MGADLMLMIRNCKEYYGDGTDVYQIASELEKIIIEIFGDHNKHQPAPSGSSSGQAMQQQDNGGGAGGVIPANVSHGSLNNTSVKNSSVGGSV